ncbi:MAG: hypothetical protein U0939_19285 [Pirellulales bacterium]
MGTTTAIFVFLASLGSTPRDQVVVDRVDLVELNHYLDDQGKPVLDQLIFYDWSTADGRYQVRAWRLLKNPTAVPQRDGIDGEYLTRWQDGQVLRKVYARQFRETWTQYDPELVEREFLPKDKRRDLRKTTPVGQASSLSRAAPRAAPLPPPLTSTPATTPALSSNIPARP